MTSEEFHNLQSGDVVRGLVSGLGFLVMDNFGDRVPAVRTVDITNPLEWVLVRKSAQRSVQLTASGVSPRARLGKFLVFLGCRLVRDGGN